MHLLALIAVVLRMVVCKSINNRQAPNIIFILADEVGWDDVGFLGSTQIPTPNLDALAADGVILNNFYVQHECTPSRSALLTGLYPIHTGTQHSVIMSAEPWGLPLDHKLLPQHLKDLGYETHIVGKWHLGSFSKEYTPTYRGFDTFYGFYSGGIDYYNHTIRVDGHVGLDFWFGSEPLWNETGHYSTTLFTERAKSVIRDRNKSKPLFLYFSHQATHSGIDVKYAAPVRNIEKFLYIGEAERIMYAALLDTLDESVGEVMEALHEENMLDNTIVVFSSDNGGSPFGPFSTRSYNWPLRGAKLSLWEGGNRVPAFVWSPLLNKKRRVYKQLMHVTDWLPTLYRAAGGYPDKLGGHLDGMDMWRHLSLDLPSPRTEMLYNIDPVDKTAALRDRNHKIVLGHQEDGQYDGRYKTTGNPRPYNDLDELTANSTVAHVLRSFYGVNDLKFPRDWRQRAKVDCGRKEEEDSNFVSGQPPYLFDLAKDPCELNNLASTHPKWVTERKYDVYPLRCLTDAVIGYRLSQQEKCIDEYRGTIVTVKWDVHEEPAPATLLDVGSQKSLERKRAKLVASVGLDKPQEVLPAAADDSLAESQPVGIGASDAELLCQLQAENEALKAENDALKLQVAELQNYRESYKLVKHLKAITKRVEEGNAVVTPAHPKVDIGSGVLVEEGALEALHSNCPGAAAKFARGLLRIVFAPEELRGRSMLGKPCNVKKDGTRKEALDPTRLQAVISYAVKLYKADPGRVRNSISSMLARELK